MHHILMAGEAQKMLSILAMQCPPNYHCGGPAYAATTSVEGILHLMGIGVTMLQRATKGGEEDWFEKMVREQAVTGSGILDQFMQHKSQILAGALHVILADLKRGQLREPEEVNEKALLSLLEWYFQKTKTDPEEFFQKLKQGGHDELIQLEKDAQDSMEKEKGPS